jgi:hypothetical protein
MRRKSKFSVQKQKSPERKKKKNCKWRAKKKKKKKTQTALQTPPDHHFPGKITSKNPKNRPQDRQIAPQSA